MSLILVFHNDGTGHESAANYNVRVMIGGGTVANSRTIATGRVSGHSRPEGWEVLVRRWLNSLEAIRWETGGKDLLK